MKRYLTSIYLSAVVGLLFSFSDSFAQAPARSSVYRVKLRGGIKLKGEIQDLQPTGTFTMQTLDGLTSTYQSADIKYVKPLKKKKYSFSEQKWRYRSIMEAGGGAAPAYAIPNTNEVFSSKGEFLVYTIQSIQYKHFFFAGLGAGFNLEGLEGASIPIFADLRLVPFKAAVSPVFVSNIGYHFNINDSSEGFYLSPGGGVKFRLSSGAEMHFIMAARSLHQTAGFYRTTSQAGSPPNYAPVYTTIYNEYEVNKRFLDFRVGFVF